SSYVHYISCDEPKIIKITISETIQMMQVITLPIKQNSPTGYLLEKIDNDILIYSTENIWLLKSNNDKITLAAPELRKYYDSIHYINILRVFGDTIWLQRSS